MQIFDNETGKTVDVPDTDIPSVLGNPRYSLPNREFEFEDSTGIRGKVAAQDVQKALADGMRFIPDSVVEKENKIAEAAQKPLQATGVGFLRGVTLGASDLALKELGVYTSDELKALEEGNPALTAISDVAGSIAPTIVSGGAGAAAKVARFAPAAIADMAGKQAAKLGGKVLAKTTSDVAKKAIQLSAGSAVEGALYGAGRLITEDAMGDAEFNAESAIAEMGKGALAGGAFGLGSTLAFKGAEKAINAAATGAVKKLNDFASSGDIGVLKKLGATKSDFKKILQSASLDEKELSDYALDIHRGFADSADDILINKGLTKTGGKGLIPTAASSLEEVAANNNTVKEGAGKLMDSALTRLDDEFNLAVIGKSSKMKPDDFVYGSDLANRIETEVLADIKDIYSPRKGAIEKMVAELKELGAVRDEMGNIISVKPLSPSQLKSQSIEFGNLAKWASTDTEGKQQVFKDLRGFLETKLEDGMSKLEGGQSIIDDYRKGKKLYQKAATLEKMIENGIARDFANNRGFSLTESIITGAGATMGGLPGAIAAYAFRKGQREYGDVALSYALRKIEKASNKSKLRISDAVDSFFKTSQKASNRYITGLDISDDDAKDTTAKVELYSQSPDQVVNNFVQNNEDLLSAAPKTSNAMQNRMVNAVQFLSSKVPQKDPSIFGDNEYRKSDLVKFRNYVEAVEQPYKVIENLKSGYITPEAVEAFKVVYPKMFQSIKDEFTARIPEFKKITEKQKAELSRILGIDSRKAYTPQGFQVLQQVSAQGVQRDLQNQTPNKIPVTAGKEIKASTRAQSGLDRVLYRT